MKRVTSSKNPLNYDIYNAFKHRIKEFKATVKKKLAYCM